MQCIAAGFEHVHSFFHKLEGKQRGLGVHEQMFLLQFSELAGVKARVGVVQIVGVILGIIIIADHPYHRCSILQTGCGVVNTNQAGVCTGDSQETTTTSRQYRLGCLWAGVCGCVSLIVGELIHHDTCIRLVSTKEAICCKWFQGLSSIWIMSWYFTVEHGIAQFRIPSCRWLQRQQSHFYSTWVLIKVDLVCLHQ